MDLTLNLGSPWDEDVEREDQELGFRYVKVKVILRTLSWDPNRLYRGREGRAGGLSKEP